MASLRRGALQREEMGHQNIRSTRNERTVGGYEKPLRTCGRGGSGGRRVGVGRPAISKHSEGA